MQTHWAKYSYIYEKLMMAVRSLAVSHGTLRERLHASYLAMYTLDLGETSWASADDRAKFQHIVHRLTSVQDPARGALAATLEAMREDEMESVAEVIWSLFLSYAYLDAEAQVRSDLQHGSDLS
ncbi:hypothetical protein KHU32_18030 [Roseococcus sp. XZZS9]|uniref:Uncharacterized protein n=2 Tax=Roseococcus pinisoli TaxID=2835040 RepID=A0ABS5QK19_9PROT|nr:hypothetical protein [Roseococcus pinisoli]